LDDLKADMLQRCQNSGQMTNFHFKHKKNEGNFFDYYFLDNVQIKVLYTCK